MKKELLLICLIFVATFSIAQAQNNTSISFQLDLREELTNIKMPEKIGIRGNQPPLSWKESYPVTDPDQDGIYEAELTFPDLAANSLIEYKYIYNESVWENVDNRIVLASGQNQSLESSAQWNTPQVLSPDQLPLIPSAQLLADFEIARKSFLALHPGLYRYNTPQELEAHFNIIKKALELPMNYQQAYLQFSKMTAKIKCGHTYANYYNQSELVKKAVFNQSDKLPFCFKIIDKRIYITENVSDNNEIKKGMEILAINNIDAKTILDSLISIIKADGPNENKRISDLEISGLGKFEGFDIYFPLFFPPQAGKYLIKVSQHQVQAEVLVKAISRIERKKRLSERYNYRELSNDELWQFKILDNQTAYLQIGTFVTWQLKLDWKMFLKTTFNEINDKKIPNLIIDIRGCEGGNDEVIYELVRYISNKKISLEIANKLVRYKKIPGELLPYLSSWDDSYKDFSGQITSSNNGFFKLKNETKLCEISANKNAFKGKTYLLINAANSSATFYLSKIVKDHQLATLVGQTTGGSQKGLNGSRIAFLHLPYSKIELDIPLIGSFYESQSTGGIEPDIPVNPSIEDWMLNTDTELETIKKLIREQH